MEACGACPTTGLCFAYRKVIGHFNNLLLYISFVLKQNIAEMS
jgi:hypothetical protein